jgi:hypothetical protein
LYLLFLGALLELAGIVFLAGRAIKHEPKAGAMSQEGTLEPAPGAVPLKGYWPGLAMLVLGALLLLVGGRT